MYIYIYIYISINRIAYGKISRVGLEGGVLSERVSAVIRRGSADSGAEREGLC